MMNRERMPEFLGSWRMIDLESGMKGFYGVGSSGWCCGRIYSRRRYCRRCLINGNVLGPVFQCVGALA